MPPFTFPIFQSNVKVVAHAMSWKVSFAGEVEL